MYHGDASELVSLKGRKSNGDYATKGSEEYTLVRIPTGYFPAHIQM